MELASLRPQSDRTGEPAPAPPRRRSAAERERLLAEYASGELGATEFAAAHGIRPTTLRTWLNRAKAAHERDPRYARRFRPEERRAHHPARLPDAVAIARAVLDSSTERARRRAVREAILAALERTGAITRTRGGRPWSAQVAEDVL